MNFLNPFSFILAALLPIIVLMYLLRLRRPQQIVSSTYLWQRLVRDVEANAPWQKLQRNILMILQLLFLIALILALANPFFWSTGTGSSSMIFIIDTSASMAATDVKPSRIEAAKQQAQSLIENSSDNTRITVISAGENTEILVSGTQDRKQAQQAINAISATFGHSDLSSALQITSAITTRQPETDIIVLSDGKVNLPERVTLRGNVFYYPIGLEEDNQGITNIQFHQNTSGDNSTLFVQVENFGSEATTRRLEIFVDDTLYDATDLDIQPFSQALYLRDGLPFDVRIVLAKLEPGDFLSTDDVAWAVNSNFKPVNIVLVTEGNRFLETALSLLPNISFSSITPLNYQASENILADLVIFDSIIPQSDHLPNSSIFFISPPKSTSLFEVGEIVEQPKPRPVSEDNPLLKNISFEGISINTASKIVLPPWANLSLSGDYNGQSIPLLFFGNYGGQRIAVLSFQFQNSDLPIQVAFPLLIANLVNWLVPNQGAQALEASSTASSVSISVPLEADSVTITPPSGNKMQKTPNQLGYIFLDAPEGGVYTIEWGEENQILVAINQFSKDESDIAPKLELNLSQIGTTPNENNSQQSRTLLWRVFGIVSLVLLTVEWAIYNRGSLSKFINTALRREIT